MNKDLSAHLTKKEETSTEQESLVIQTTDLDPIVQQEPTPCKDDTTPEDDFLL